MYRNNRWQEFIFFHARMSFFFYTFTYLLLVEVRLEREREGLKHFCCICRCKYIFVSEMWPVS
jgi:hypothetical protein